MFGRVMVAIGGVIVVVLFAALVAPFFLNWSSFRVEFEEQASRVLGKKVSVHGDVDARILPFPSITLHDVRVGQDVDGRPQAQIASFSMDMELAPFLSGEARIFDMRIEQPTARVRVLKDGTLDWMRGSRAAIPTRVVVIEDVHVSGGTIEVIDEQSGRTRQLSGLAAEMSAASLVGPWRGEGRATLDGEEARFSLSTGSFNTQEKRLPLRLRLWPDSEPLDVNLEGELALLDNVPTYRGSFSASVLDEENETEPLVEPPPGPRVKGSFELTNDRVRVADYRLEVGALDDPYVVTGEATLDTGVKSEFLLTAEGQQIDVNRLGQQGERGKTGRDAGASAQRRLQAFIKMAASIPIPPVDGRASLVLPAVVLNDTTIRDIQLDVRPADTGWTVERAIATFPGRTRMEAKGALVLEGAPSFAGSMLFASTQPSGLADWLSGGVDPAIRQLRTAGFSATVDLTTQAQRFEDLELAIGPATLKGRIERQSQGTPSPGMSVDLSGDEIDLDAMRALASLVTGEDAGRSVLDHRLEARLKAERFTAFGVAAENVDTAFTMDGGVLSLGHLSAGNIAGATLSAQGRVEGSLLDYRGAGKVNFQSADPTAFLAMLKRQLPAHPVLDRLNANASFFADATLSADVTVGQGNGGVAADVSGTINGSAITAKVGLPTLLDLTGGDAMSLSLSMENPQSETLLGQAGLEILPFGGDGAGRLSLDLQQPAEGVATSRVEFSTERTKLAASGDVSLRATDFAQGRGHVSLLSRNLEPYLLISGIGIPQFGSGLPVELESDFSITPDAIALSALNGQVAGNSFDGKLSADRRGTARKAEGTMTLDSVDLAWLGEAVFGPLSEPSTGAPSETPFALPVFSGSELVLDLKARSFSAGEFGTVSDFSGKLAHRGDAISLENVSGQWRGGKVSGQLLMSNGGGTGIVQTKIRADDVDVASLAWRKDGRPVASGKLSFDASAEASGGSVLELGNALSGSGDMRFSGVTVEGINPDLLGTLMAAADRSRKDTAKADVERLAAEAVHAGHVALGDVRAPFTITGGEFRVQEMKAAARGVSLSAAGTTRLVDGRLDGAVALTYDAGDEALAGGEPTIRLVYSGERESPRETIDAGAMTNFLTMRAYEQERRRVEMLQSSVLEKQRLRREVALYNFNAATRAAEKARLEAEEKARLEAEEKARLEIIKAAKAAEAERQRQFENLQFDLPPAIDNLNPGGQTGAPFDGGSLPGVGQ